MKQAGATQLASSACLLSGTRFSSLRRSLAEGHRRKPVPQNGTRRENTQNDIRGDGNFIGSGWQQNKTTISLSNSLKNTPARQKASFPPHVPQTTYYSVVPHQPRSCHLPGLSSVSVLLCVILMSAYTILSVWKPSSFRDKDHERKRCSCPQKHFRKL